METIRYRIDATPVGKVLFAAGERGLVCLYLGEDDEALARECRLRYPGAILDTDHEGLRGFAAKLGLYMEGLSDKLPDLEIDVRGSPFQREVWRAISAIPPGETRSYSELAALIGRPKAVRAVARACGANELAILIPCHRVIRADGGLGGYRWGIEWKRMLLEREKRQGSLVRGAKSLDA